MQSTTTISKTKADKAGEALAKAVRCQSRLPEDAVRIVDIWRVTHGEPLAWVAQSVKGRLDGLDAFVPVAHRLKRKPQIIAKLARTGSMRLTQMQDVGGCRAVLRDLEAVQEAEARILSRASPWYQVRDRSDYREHARASGYRALHLIVERDARQIEIQLRTRRQHAWAEAVERAAARTGFPLKDGEGPADLLRFFQIASEGFALLDQEESVPDELITDLRRLDRNMTKYFPKRAPQARPEVELGGGDFATRINHWILIYDWSQARIRFWADAGTDGERAARQYAALERSYPPKDGFEVVLIGADSQATIRKTHAHYFGRTADDLDPHGVFGELLGAH